MYWSLYFIVFVKFFLLVGVGVFFNIKLFRRVDMCVYWMGNQHFVIKNEIVNEPLIQLLLVDFVTRVSFSCRCCC